MEPAPFPGTAAPAAPRKIRSDAKLERLTPAQRERLRVWLEDENRTYHEVVALVRAEFGLTVGKSAVALYWRRHFLPARYSEEAAIAAAIAALPAGAFDAATLNQARALAWAALTSQFPQVQEAATLLQLLHRADRLALARQRLALAERRVHLAEALAKASRPYPNHPVPSASDSRSTPNLAPIALEGHAPERTPAACPEQAVLGQHVVPSAFARHHTRAAQGPEPAEGEALSLPKGTPPPTSEPLEQAKKEIRAEQSPNGDSTAGESDLLAPPHPLLATSSSAPPSPTSASALPPFSPSALPRSPGYSALLPAPEGDEPKAVSLSNGKSCSDDASYRAPSRDIRHGHPPPPPPPSAPAPHQTPSRPPPRIPILTQAPWA